MKIETTTIGATEKINRAFPFNHISALTLSQSCELMTLAANVELQGNILERYSALPGWFNINGNSFPDPTLKVPLVC